MPKKNGAGVDTAAQKEAYRKAKAERKAKPGKPAPKKLVSKRKR